MKTLYVLLMSFCLLSGGLGAEEPTPVKVYIFAGQSNMGGGINFSVGPEHGGHKHHPASRWMESEENDVLYFWNRGRGKQTDTWERLNAKSHYGHWEQVVAHRLWKAEREAGSDARIAVITVTVGATSMNGFWEAGGRAQREGDKNWIKTSGQGKGNAMLRETVAKALQQLEKQGMTYDIKAFVWYQGEGDSLHLFQAKNYERLLRDMIDGWEDRDPASYKDDKAKYAGSVVDLTGDEVFNRVIVRVSERIEGASSWGPKDKWQPALDEVRRAQKDYAESRDDAAWVNVDDLPLSDDFHYHGAEYIRIGERVAKALLTLQGRGKKNKGVRNLSIDRMTGGG